MDITLIREPESPKINNPKYQQIKDESGMIMNYDQFKSITTYDELETVLYPERLTGVQREELKIMWKKSKWCCCCL